MIRLSFMVILRMSWHLVFQCHKCIIAALVPLYGSVAASGSGGLVLPYGVSDVGDINVTIATLEPSVPVKVCDPGVVVEASMAPPSSSVLPSHPFVIGSLTKSIPKEAAWWLLNVPLIVEIGGLSYHVGH